MDVDKWLGSITLYEAVQIWERFQAACSSSRLVLWSGISFEQAESWAREHDRQTLTQAMGSLMEDKSDPACRHHIKTSQQWSCYVHAASIPFTIFISTGTEVVVLTRHPPQRLNPHGTSYYQHIEEPWLKACCDGEKFKIMFAHPRIKAAINHIYEYWPTDRVDEWTSRYPGAEVVQRWTSHTWDLVQQSSYQPSELRQTRATILEKMFLYTTGPAVYWHVAMPANRIGTVPSEKKRRAIIASSPLQRTSVQSKPTTRQGRNNEMSSRKPTEKNRDADKERKDKEERKKVIKRERRARKKLRRMEVEKERRGKLWKMEGKDKQVADKRKKEVEKKKSKAGKRSKEEKKQGAEKKQKAENKQKAKKTEGES